MSPAVKVDRGRTGGGDSGHQPSTAGRGRGILVQMHCFDITATAHDAPISEYESHGAHALPLGGGRGDGVRQPLAAGQGAFIARGEVHAKGSDAGLTAIMVQLTDLTPATHE